jgi:predicted dienelactone hydrolase
MVLGGIVVMIGLATGIQAEDPASKAYDPLKIAPAQKVTTHDLVVSDSSRMRELPVLVYLAEAESPTARQPAPVVLFSHGLGGSRFGSKFLGEHWARRGYVAVFTQHPGSDEAVWRGTPVVGRMTALKEAASAQNAQARWLDIPAVLDQLTKWTAEPQHPLHGTCDMTKVGMSGHSFGANTTQGVSGQSFPVIGQRLTDSRIDAAIPFSPGMPALGDGTRQFQDVRIPWLLMTGTKDVSVIGSQTAESRRKVYAALPSTIDKYELVLHNAEHSVFTERALPGEREPRNPKHHPAIMALSTAFWDTYLRDDPAAREWLTGPASRSVLEPEDVWQQSHPAK